MVVTHTVRILTVTARKLENKNSICFGRGGGLWGSARRHLRMMMLSLEPLHLDTAEHDGTITGKGGKGAGKGKGKGKGNRRGPKARRKAIIVWCGIMRR